MKSTIEMLDNKHQGRVISTLKEHIATNSTVSVISSEFSLHAFTELKKHLKKINKFKLLVAADFNNKDNFINNLQGVNLDRHLRNQLNISSIARECSKWLQQKAEVKQAQTSIGQNFINIENNNTDANLAIVMGNSAFNTDGLGIAPSENIHMINCFYEQNQVQNYINMFNQLWETNNNNFLTELQQALKAIYGDKTAQQIYFLTLFNLFQDNINELNEDNIIKTKTGIKDTLVWQKLYKFQRDGVLGAIEKIEKYNGCIIADSVGLGKTFEALAIIKYYELRNDRILVLAPKKLRENWSIYTINDKRNIFVNDRFNFDILNHSDLTRQQGKSGELNLATLNWGNYDLVVIDESHNFRNNPSYKEGSITRYAKLMNDIIQAGVKTKVLMLSATPVNNRMNDLKNQVAFIVEGKDNALVANNIPSISQTLKIAQTHFNKWLDAEEDQRTTEVLLNNLNYDYFKLLDLVTIARSRKHIEKYYDLNEIGNFPTRLKPINRQTDIDIKRQFPSINEINRDIRILNLSAYSPLKYVLPHKKQKYSEKYDKKLDKGSIFKQTDREQSLTYLIRTNLFKRLESSINSFTLTLDKLLKGVNILLDKIAHHNNNDSIEEFNINEIDTEDEAFAPFMIGDKIKVLIQDMDIIRWQQELEADKIILEQLIHSAQQVSAPRDEKLREIKQLIRNKVNNPINSNNKKIIIFTAFADTANYLYDNIAEWAATELKLYSALVTGSSDNKTTMPNIRKDLLSIITNFSPISKERNKLEDDFNTEIDILIATDCIAEGQNLQDCDYLINYDIHWNPVRIIQRFGRIDRLGSQNTAIQLVNFWPNIELDEYINLESRVSGRMVLLDISATGEENIIEEDHGKMKDLEYRRKQLQKLQTEAVDLDELESGISITDLTLNDFRMELSDYLEKTATALDAIPLGAYATIDINNHLADNITSGVIFLLENTGKQLLTAKNYALAPYYLIYVADDGSIVISHDQTKKLLDTLKKITKYNKCINDNAINIFAQSTNAGTDMSHYQRLLAVAVQSITGAAAEQGVASLFSPGGTTIDQHSFKAIDDFEVISYLILVDSTN